MPTDVLSKRKLPDTIMCLSNKDGYDNNNMVWTNWRVEFIVTGYNCDHYRILHLLSFRYYTVFGFHYTVEGRTTETGREITTHVNFLCGSGPRLGSVIMQVSTFLALFLTWDRIFMYERYIDTKIRLPAAKLEIWYRREKFLIMLC